MVSVGGVSCMCPQGHKTVEKKIMSTTMRVVLSALDSKEWKYETPREDVVIIRFGDINGMITVDDERNIIQGSAYCSVGIKDEQRHAALDLINRFNKDKISKYYLDDDGDIRTEATADTDGGIANEAIVLALVARVIGGMQDIHEDIMRVRYAS